MAKQQNTIGTTPSAQDLASSISTPSSSSTADLNPTQQSQLNREANYNDSAAAVGSKLASDPTSVTKEDGDLLHSRETKAFGTTEKGGLASQAQSLASENTGDKKSTSSTTGQGLTSEQQSQLDREANYIEAADKVGTKMASDPASVTKEDGDLLHSREHKAFGSTEKDGLAAKAQSQAARNDGDAA